MLRHNLLIIYRNIKRYKSTFFINLIGLSTGLACALIIYLWVNDELNVDKFSINDNKLYQVMENARPSSGVITQEATPDLLADALVKEIPEVKYATAVTPAKWFGKFPLAIKDKKIKATGQFAGNDFFNVFSFNLLSGDKNKVLENRNSIVISKQLANNLFGSTENAIGKSIDWEILNYNAKSVVSGVFDDIPNNSMMQFDFVLSFGAWKDVCNSIKRTMAWFNHGPGTYIVLKDGADIAQVNRKISGFLKSKYAYSNVDLFIRKYSSGYLYNKYDNGVQSGGRIEYVKLFSIIALIILLIACINFMNLSTAKASQRFKEVGIKKTIGASRKELIVQYICESMFMSVLSILVAIMLVEIILPQFNVITDKHLSIKFSASLVLSLIGITLFTGFISGSYPALYLSGFNPATILKGKYHTNLVEVLMRKGLVILQFTLSIIFIAAVLVVYRQMDYIQTRNMGYNKDNVIYFDKDGSLTTKQDTFLNELATLPGVKCASESDQNIIGMANATEGVNWEGKNPDETIRFSFMLVNYNMLETVGIQMKEGRTFSKWYSTDSSAVIFNEAAIKIMGFKNPIGKVINLWGKNVQIIGVAKDFNFESLHENVKPSFFSLKPELTMIMMAKIAAGKERETISKIEQLYHKYNPGYTFDYKFLDKDFQAQYQAEQRVSVLSKYFAGIAIIISCLGLFGLAAFTAERRRKEIGIRKVLGASEAGIIYLLSSSFTKLIVVSIVFALPLSYIIAKNWLNSFAYKIDLNPWYFVTAGLMALLISWLTVMIHAVKAAIANPVKSIKYE